MKIINIKSNIATIKGEYKYRKNSWFDLGNDIKGFLLHAKEDVAQLLIFGNSTNLKINTTVKQIDGYNTVEVFNHYFGKIINPFGNVVFPADFKEPDQKELLGVGQLFADSPSIIDRRVIDRPLKTGVLAIDSIIPIGLGQRELILGDRNTGKTWLAQSTIINQANKKIKTIYVAIGQKRSSVIKFYQNLKKHGSEDNFIIMFASSESSAEQYLIPYFGFAMAEAFAHKGEDVLVVLDDLTRHADVYREVSLVIGKTPGYEAYPTDMFFEHASLLERAGSFGEKYKNGTLTALPIANTVKGDITGIIPSNLVSITDGQIIMSTELFNQSFYPAIKILDSVSRVGSAAQSQLIKKHSQNLKRRYSILFESKKFSSISSENERIKKQIEDFNGINSLIKQFGFVVYSEIEMAILIKLFWLGNLNDIEKSFLFAKGFQNYVKNDPLAKIGCAKLENLDLTDEDFSEVITKIFKPFIDAYNKKKSTFLTQKELNQYLGR